MNSLMMVVLLSCGPIDIINLTDTPMDVKVIERARLVCKQTYNGCVKRIIKVKDRDYQVICEDN